MLNEVVTSGTGRGAALASGMYTAGKTGTTSNNNDRWFVGYTPHYVAAVWYGYDTPREINVSGNPCIPVWKEVMTAIHKNKKVITEPEKPTDIKSASYCPSSGLRSSSRCGGRQSFYFASDNMPKGTCNIKHATIPKEEDKDEKNNDRRVNPQTPTRPGVIPNPPKNIDPSIVDRISPTKPNNTAPNNVSPKVPTPTTPTAPKTN